MKSIDGETSAEKKRRTPIGRSLSSTLFDEFRREWVN
jgi:hypothetical protein